ncbi:MAG: hypothetical protein IIC92_11005 [Chloroflexi bacterium]|nr:hypothetical protein [Chloroflexota bacterium]
MANPWDDAAHLAKRRLDWAGCGIDRFEVLADAFLATEPYEIVTEVEREGQNAHFTYEFKVLQHPPPELSFAAGDVIHNLRSALDNLVWAVGRTVKARKLPLLEFHLSTDDAFSRYLAKIRKFPDPIKDWITSIQPNRAPNYPDMFYALHLLWGGDKHRTPVLMADASYKPIELGYVGERQPLMKIRVNKFGDQKHDQKIAWAVVPWKDKDDFKPGFTPHVAFDADGPAGTDRIVGRPQEVTEYLRHIQKSILDRVIPRFEPYFAVSKFGEG